MPTHQYTTNEQRVGVVLGEMLAHAIPVEVLSLGCKMKEMPKNKGNTVKYRRYLPKGATATNVNTQNRPSVDAAAHIVAEGVTPAADTLVPVDVPAVLQQYACLYSYTDVAEDLYEDDIPEEEKIQTAERMALVREMIRYGAMKSGTNVIYAGGTSRTTVDEAISMNVIRRMTRTLNANHAKHKRRFLAASANYNTFTVEPAYLVFCHTDCKPDIRDLPNFTHTKDYARREPVSPEEIGSHEEFRFLCSPELNPYIDSGAAVGSTGLLSTGGAQIDVYPYIVMAEDAFYDIALRGSRSMEVIHTPVNQKSKADPLQLVGYVGAKFYSAAQIINGGWMGIIEAGSRALV